MTRVKSHESQLGINPLYMMSYVEKGDGYSIPSTEKEAINACGTQCCVSGWLALSPEFKELGVIQGEDGEAILPEFAKWKEWYQPTAMSLAKLFDLPAEIVDVLIYDFEITTIDEVVDRMNSWLAEHKDSEFDYSLPEESFCYE